MQIIDDGGKLNFRWKFPFVKVPCFISRSSRAPRSIDLSRYERVTFQRIASRHGYRHNNQRRGSFSRECKIRRCKTSLRETERVSHATDFLTVTVVTRNDPEKEIEKIPACDSRGQRDDRTFVQYSVRIEFLYGNTVVLQF